MKIKLAIKRVAVGLLSHNIWRIAIRPLLLTHLLAYSLTHSLFAMSAEDYFFRAGEKYTQGDTENAISDLEKGLKLNPKDKQAKDFLGLCLNEISLKYYVAGEYQSALPYLEKLNKFSPDPEVIKMYNHAKKEVETASLGLPGVPLKKEVSTVISKSEKRIQKQKETVEKQKEGPQKELLESVLAKAENEIAKLSVGLNQIDEKMGRIDSQQKELKKTYIFYSVGGFAALGGFIFLLVLISGYISHKRLKAFHEKLVLQSGSGKTPSITYGTEEIDKIMTDIDSRTQKIYGIDVIDAELVSETDVTIGEKLLQPFIEDDDPLVRAKAFQSLWKYNPERAIVIIKTMLQDTDTSQRLNTIDILKGMSSPASVELLLELAGLPETEQNEEIKREVIKTLSDIWQKKEISLPQELSLKVEKFLQETKKKWVVS
ncbi:MAG: HEAT repeat domain-containing protein [Elusimicrobia bacterium]|nr:HEAT repeat domain-containing protein [Elusimicrobiota bacterium]